MENKGIKINSSIVPNSSLDTYPTHLEEYGQGGYRSVNTLEDLIAIPDERKKEGMVVYVKSEDKEYRLVNDNNVLIFDDANSSLKEEMRNEFKIEWHTLDNNGNLV